MDSIEAPESDEDMEKPISELVDELLELVIQQGRFVVDLLPRTNDEENQNASERNRAPRYCPPTASDEANVNVDTNMVYTRGIPPLTEVAGTHAGAVIHLSQSRGGGAGHNMAAGSSSSSGHRNKPLFYDAKHADDGSHRYIPPPEVFTAEQRGSTGSSVSLDDEDNPFVQDRKPRCCPVCTIL